MDGSSFAPEALAMLMTLATALSQQQPRRQPPPPSPSLPSTPVVQIDLTATTPPNYHTPSPSASSAASGNPHRDEVNRQLVGGTGSVSSGVGVGDRTLSPNFNTHEVVPGKRKRRVNVIGQGSLPKRATV